jgi:site-specific DNA-methyltransferase (adenine-specific)
LSYRIICGDALTVLKTMPEESVQCCVTSPPYWGLRDYGVVGQLGLEPTIELYIAHIVEVFREVRRVLKNDATLWLNMGDSYCSDAGADRKPTTLAGARVPSGWTNRAQPHRVHALRKGKDKDPKRGASADSAVISAVTGLKPKDLCMIPARVALALQADGWWLRSEIVWHKPNPMPESIRDRPTKSHEMLYLLSKSERYFYDADAIKEPTTGSAHDRARKNRAADGQKTLPTAERNGVRPAFERLGREGLNSRMHQDRDANHSSERKVRAPGVNPKAQKWPNAWSAEDGRHDGIGNGRFRPSGNKERKLAGPANGRLETHMGSGVPWPPQIRPKQNESFSAAVVRTVERRNRRTVWTIATKPFSGAHFATFPPKLIEPCILAGSRPGDVVLDPFGGAMTTALVAQEHGRDSVMIELKPEYVKMGDARLADARAGSAPVLRRRFEPGGVEQADTGAAKKPRSLFQ